MTPFVARRGRLDWRQALLGLTLAVVIGAMPRPVLAEQLPNSVPIATVQVDQARLVKMPANTATLVVGNPLIADVSVQPGGLLVITGKSYGMTNVIALDRGGAVLLESQVEVQGPAGNVVMVFRGIDRESYSCTPNCERRITLGDTPNYFTATLTQSGTLNTQAQSTAQPPK